MQATRITRTAVAALGAFALTAPTAGAMVPPADTGSSSGGGPGVSDAAQRSSGETNAGGIAADVTQARFVGVSDAAQRHPGETNAGSIAAGPPEVRPIVADDGLDWGDAAIGGASAVFIVTLLAGGGAAIGRRQRTSLAS